MMKKYLAAFLLIFSFSVMPAFSHSQYNYGFADLHQQSFLQSVFSRSQYYSRSQYDYYGAIAFSQSTGATGGAWDYDSEYGASNAAINSCGKSDCRAVLVFWNTCGALAVGDNGGWGGGYGQQDYSARTEALDTCRRYGNTNCRVYYSVCTTRQTN